MIPGSNLGHRLPFRCDEHPSFVVHVPSPISAGREGVYWKIPKSHIGCLNPWSAAYISVGQLHLMPISFKMKSNKIVPESNYCTAFKPSARLYYGYKRNGCSELQLHRFWEGIGRLYLHILSKRNVMIKEIGPRRVCTNLGFGTT